MITGVFYINEENNLAFRAYSEDHTRFSECYNEEAIKTFNRTVLWQQDEQPEYEIDGDNKRLKGKSFDIEFKNYSETIQRIYKEKRKLEKKNKVKKIVGTVAAVGTAVAIPVGFLIKDLIDINNDEHEKAKGIVGEPIATEEQTQQVISEEIDAQKEIEKILADTETEEKKTDENSRSIYLDIEEHHDQKLLDNVMKYWDIIEKVSKKWGIDPLLLRDIIMQESFGGTVENKGQLEFDKWENQILKLYNHEDDKFITMVLTNNPEKYKNVDIRITEDDLKNPYTNFSVTAAVISYTFNTYTKGNIPIAIQMYNNGYGAMMDILNEQARVEGKTFEEVFSDKSNTGFLEYTYIRDKVNNKGEVVHHADPNYLRHVTEQEFDEEKGKTYVMPLVNKDGTITEVSYTFTNQREKTQQEEAKVL